MSKLELDQQPAGCRIHCPASWCCREFAMGRAAWWPLAQTWPAMGASAFAAARIARRLTLASRALLQWHLQRSGNRLADHAGALACRLIGESPFYVAHEKCRCLGETRQRFRCGSDGSLFSKRCSHPTTSPTAASSGATPVSPWAAIVFCVSSVLRWWRPAPGAPTHSLILLTPRHVSRALEAYWDVRDATTARAGPVERSPAPLPVGRPAGAWRWTPALIAESWA